MTASQITPPISTPPDESNRIDIAVIGAGMAGLSCARRLAEAGRQVVLFDKSRGVGGRMATRRREQSSFDHGAQYFTVHDAAFAEQVAKWQQAGAVAEWTGLIYASDADGQLTQSSAQARYVGTPRMSALARHLLADLPCHLSHRLTALHHDGDCWHLSFDGQPEQLAHQVVLALPAPQLAALFAPEDQMHQLAASVQMQPTWAVMIDTDEVLDVPFEGCFVNHGVLSWVACNSSKPARPHLDQSQSWVLHANSEWSQDHVDDPVEQIQAACIAAFGDLIDQPLKVDMSKISTHRWLYALAEQPLEQGCGWDAVRGLGVAGDWLHGSRVEGAWLSGQRLAEQMLFGINSIPTAFAIDERDTVLSSDAVH